MNSNILNNFLEKSTDLMNQKIDSNLIQQKQTNFSKPKIIIIEQPANAKLRFR